MWLLSVGNLQKTEIKPAVACQDAWNPTFSRGATRWHSRAARASVWSIHVQLAFRRCGHARRLRY